MTLEQKETLDRIVPSYGVHSEEKSKIEKVCKEENAKIKEILGMNGEHIAGGYKVTVSTTPNETMDEEKLIEIIHKYKLAGIIRKKEYVDFDKLEGMIYHGKIPAEVLAEMNTCKTSKPTTKLYIKKAGGKENGKA